MDCDDLGTINIDAAEDFAECLLAQLIWDGWVPPQGAELHQEVPSASQPQLIGW